MSALQNSLRALRTLVSERFAVQQSFGGASFNIYRAFADVKGSFVDRKQVEERVIETVKKFDKVDAGKVAIGSSFQKDLGLDSLDTVEVVMSLEEEFGCEIPDAEAEKILTVKDAVDFFTLQPAAVPKAPNASK